VFNKPTRVLIVDNEKDLAGMLSLIIKDLGTEVAVANGGKECLEILVKQDFDVVILDVWMPGLNGIKTLKEIKKGYPLVEVIILTGHGTVHDAVQAMKIGAFDYLLKPVDYDELLSKLEAAATRKHKQEERIKKADTQSFFQEETERREEGLSIQEDVHTEPIKQKSKLNSSKIPANVLIVDDEKEFVEMLALRLETAGEDVLSAYSGNECLEILNQKEIGVVLLDIEMPGMGGIETLKKIKEKYPLVEVIILTAYATIETAVQGMKLGAYDYLLKPPDFVEIKSKLKSAGRRKEKQEQRIQDAMDYGHGSLFS